MAKVRAYLKTNTAVKVNTGPPLASVLKQHDADPDALIAFIKKEPVKFTKQIEDAVKAMKEKGRKKKE